VPFSIGRVSSGWSSDLVSKFATEPPVGWWDAERL
jgi:hypothetical protein